MKKIAQTIKKLENRFQKIEKIYKILNVIIEFILSIILAFSIYQIIIDKILLNSISFKYLIISILTGIIILSIIIWNSIYYRKKIEKIFLSIIIPIGMFYLVLMLPYHVPDEAPHFIRAYETYQGEFISSINEEGKHRANIPIHLKELNLSNLKDYRTLQEQLQKKTDYSKKEEAYTEAQSYPGILYIFSGIGMQIGEMLNLNIIVTMYLARILNFIFFLFLAYYAVKKIPFGKIMISSYFLLPMVLQQAASVSPDSMINGIAIFFIAYVIYLTLKAEQITKKEIIMIIGISAFLAVAKIVYMPIVFLLLLIISNPKISKKQKLIVIIGSVLIAIILGSTWYVYQTRYHDERDYVKERDINSTEQIKNIISNPLGYTKTLNETFKKMGLTYILDFAGASLGWQNIDINKFIIITALFLLIISGWFEKNEICLSAKQKIWNILIAIGSIVLVFTALYIAWTEVGAGIVVGVQGRYFIPIIILLTLCLCMKNNYIKVKYIPWFYFIAFSIINLIAIKTIVQFFI